MPTFRVTISKFAIAQATTPLAVVLLIFKSMVSLSVVLEHVYAHIYTCIQLCIVKFLQKLGTFMNNYYL